MNITGTFLDEISHDIPSSNWDERQWSADFDAMAADGIDTVILIRAGHREKCTFNSKVLARHRTMRPAYVDLVDMFLQLAQDHGMKFFFGTYDSGTYWTNNNPEKEIEINLDFTSEFMDRYGHREALGGWYICHEIPSFDETAVRVYESLARHLRELKNLPILISPYLHGASGKLTPAAHEQAWKPVFARIKGLIDIVAFQDGHVPFAELPDYLAVNARMAKEHGIACWSNIESFERGMAMNFLPIGWQNMRFKMESAVRAGAEKLITFEYSHFLSPNSIFASGRNLSGQYRKWIAENRSLQ